MQNREKTAPSREIQNYWGEGQRPWAEDEHITDQDGMRPARVQAVVPGQATG